MQLITHKLSKEALRPIFGAIYRSDQKNMLIVSGVKGVTPSIITNVAKESYLDEDPKDDKFKSLSRNWQIKTYHPKRQILRNVQEKVKTGSTFKDQAQSFERKKAREYTRERVIKSETQVSMSNT
ncbi:hypothetical protein CR513_36913, partial [Mucuna pruriens]